MDIGKPGDPFYAEPLEDPFKPESPPEPTPDRELEEEEVEVPA